MIADATVLDVCHNGLYKLIPCSRNLLHGMRYTAIRGSYMTLSTNTSRRLEAAKVLFGVERSRACEPVLVSHGQKSCRTKLVLYNIGYKRIRIRYTHVIPYVLENGIVLCRWLSKTAEKQRGNGTTCQAMANPFWTWLAAKLLNPMPARCCFKAHPQSSIHSCMQAASIA